jgi:DNA-binding MarR family transcriptional regulator
MAWEMIMGGPPETSAPVKSAELVDLLTWAQRTLTRGLGTLFDEEGATIDQWRLLRSLNTTDGRPMGELATSLEIPHPTLTRLVDGLVDSAHLYRTQSSEDRRRVSVHLSTRGRHLLDRLEALASAHENALTHRLGPDVIHGLVGSLTTVRHAVT